MPREHFLNENGVVDTLESDNKILGLFGKYRPLSNFHTEYVTVDVLTYRCSEAAYMAQKTDSMEEKRKLTLMLGKEAKQFGQQVTLRSDWEEIKYDRMLKVLRAKFTQYEYLKDLLLSTGDKYIEETNWWKDTYWGVCDGHGQNNLGKILMLIRFELRNN